MKRASILALAAAGVLMTFCAPQKSSNPAVESLVDRYVMFWNTGNFDGIEEVMHPDFTLRMSPEFEPRQGLEGFMSEVRKWRTGYPDFNVVIDDMIHTDSSIASRWTITATNTGEGTHPPTGKTVRVTGMSMVHLKDGKIFEEWISGNDYSWMQQLGFFDEQLQQTEDKPAAGPTGH